MRPQFGQVKAKKTKQNNDNKQQQTSKKLGWGRSWFGLQVIKEQFKGQE